MNLIILILGIVNLILLLCGISLVIKKIISNQSDIKQLQIRLEERDKVLRDFREHTSFLFTEQQKESKEYRLQFDNHQLTTLKTLQESMQAAMGDIRKQIAEILYHHSELINQKMDKLTSDTDLCLKDITQQVDKRLTDGFEKTTATFTDIIKRIALIDEAQKKITELSSNVISLQEVLADKRSRGAFGEVQLNHLIQNILPEQSYRLQYTLSNDKRADAILFLPEPTGNIVIDAKFPLESFRRYTDISLSALDRKAAEQQFKVDVRKHIQDVHNKYIILGETSDGAVMFIPAEAIFSEIHSRFPELIDLAHSLRVWLVSPTTFMAVLNTARAVLKDAATRKQIHLIQQHLILLGKDFERFQKRIDNLTKHIHLAHQDVEEVHKSSKKLSSRFIKIEKVDLHSNTEKLLGNEVPSAIEEES
jgi:DNA recombination protein RmuC